ncbi:hypothetical protein PACTADRAFT_48652 [Pachysolen tannophilus NRRL Y-2460]|uniref:Uncharacterized protein n=1 Tax=Pachysolen tannophilus NRRL Y-2460 TaxID=669874 RepID=A0A1E4TYN4_PACTA|nr:hypothetical protein PACTADRAFT_48652 [Pachysolen tannophilus NRRL Y-2460]
MTAASIKAPQRSKLPAKRLASESIGLDSSSDMIRKDKKMTTGLGKNKETNHIVSEDVSEDGAADADDDEESRSTDESIDLTTYTPPPSTTAIGSRNLNHRSESPTSLLGGNGHLHNEHRNNNINSNVNNNNNNISSSSAHDISSAGNDHHILRSSSSLPGNSTHTRIDNTSSKPSSSDYQPAEVKKNLEDNPEYIALCSAHALLRKQRKMIQSDIINLRDLKIEALENPTKFIADLATNSGIVEKFPKQVHIVRGDLKKVFK